MSRDILSVSLLSLMCQAESVVTQVEVHLGGLDPAGEDPQAASGSRARIVALLRGRQGLVRRLAAEARRVVPARDEAERRCVAASAAADDALAAVRAWQAATKEALRIDRATSSQRALDVDVVLGLLAFRVRYWRTTATWLDELVPTLEHLACRLDPLAAATLGEGRAVRDALRATLTALEVAEARRAEVAADADRLRDALREQLRELDRGWRAARVLVPGLPTLDLTVAAGAAARGARRVAADEADLSTRSAPPAPPAPRAGPNTADPPGTSDRPGPADPPGPPSGLAASTCTTAAPRCVLPDAADVGAPASCPADAVRV